MNGKYFFSLKGQAHEIHLRFLELKYEPPLVFYIFLLEKYIFPVNANTCFLINYVSSLFMSTTSYYWWLKIDQ
jgi:hypothetical protein